VRIDERIAIEDRRRGVGSVALITQNGFEGDVANGPIHPERTCKKDKNEDARIENGWNK